MHVCLAIDGSFIGGGHVHVYSLAKAIVARGDRVTVLNSAPGPFSSLLAENGIPVSFVPMGKIPYVWKRMVWQRVLTDLSPDILHLHGAVAGFWGRFGVPRVRAFKILYTIHGIQFVHRRNILARMIFWFSERFLRDVADLILCVSASDMRDSLDLRIARKDQLRLVSNGVRLNQKISVQLDRPALGIPNDAFVAGCVGRLTYVKGQSYAIQAVRILRGRYPNLHLVLIGIGEDEDKLRRIVKRYGLEGKVHFIGFVKQPLAALKLLDVHLFPSLWEGQGIALMEAMLAGVPSVASNVNGIPEVARDRKEALLVPSKDAARLAEAIETLIKDPELRRRLADNGRERVKLYDEVKTIQMTLSLYTDEN